MERIEIEIGRTQRASDGSESCTMRTVEFRGEELAKRSVAGQHKGRPTDTRGTRETLFRTEDGRMLVHVLQWSHWQGEPDIATLQEVSEADLGVNGQFEFLGQQAGFGRPLTLDEALVTTQPVTFEEFEEEV